MGKGKRRRKIVKMIEEVLRDLRKAASPWVKLMGRTWPIRLKGWRSVDKSSMRKKGIHVLQGTL